MIPSGLSTSFATATRTAWTKGCQELFSTEPLVIHSPKRHSVTRKKWKPLMTESKWRWRPTEHWARVINATLQLISLISYSNILMNVHLTRPGILKSHRIRWPHLNRLAPWTDQEKRREKRRVCSKWPLNCDPWIQATFASTTEAIPTNLV